MSTLTSYIAGCQHIFFLMTVFAFLLCRIVSNLIFSLYYIFRKLPELIKSTVESVFQMIFFSGIINWVLPLIWESGSWLLNVITYDICSLSLRTDQVHETEKLRRATNICHKKFDEYWILFQEAFITPYSWSFIEWRFVFFSF